MEGLITDLICSLHKECESKGYRLNPELYSYEDWERLYGDWTNMLVNGNDKFESFFDFLNDKSFLFKLNNNGTVDTTTNLQTLETVKILVDNENQDSETNQDSDSNMSEDNKDSDEDQTRPYFDLEDEYLIQTSEMDHNETPHVEPEQVSLSITTGTQTKSLIQNTENILNLSQKSENHDSSSTEKLNDILDPTSFKTDTFSQTSSEESDSDYDTESDSSPVSSVDDFKIKSTLREWLTSTKCLNLYKDEAFWFGKLIQENKINLDKIEINPDHQTFINTLEIKDQEIDENQPDESQNTIQEQIQEQIQSPLEEPKENDLTSTIQNLNQKLESIQNLKLEDVELSNLKKDGKKKPTILVVGNSGVGKSSMIKSMIKLSSSHIPGKNISLPKVGFGLRGKTMDIETFESDDFIWLDSCGLDEPKEGGTITCAQSICQILNFLKLSDQGIDLIIFVHRDRISRSFDSNYKFFYEIIGQKLIPCALVLTGAELTNYYSELSDQQREEKDNELKTKLASSKYEFSQVISCCFAESEDRNLGAIYSGYRQQSYSRLICALEKLFIKNTEKTELWCKISKWNKFQKIWHFIIIHFNLPTFFAFWYNHLLKTKELFNLDQDSFNQIVSIFKTESKIV